MFTVFTKQMYRDWTNIAKKNALFFSKKLNVSFQFNVKQSERLLIWDLIIWNGRNRNCESTDFVCSDTDAYSNTDIKAYVDEPIADEAWLDNYRK